MKNPNGLVALSILFWTGITVAATEKKNVALPEHEKTKRVSRNIVTSDCDDHDDDDDCRTRRRGTSVKGERSRAAASPSGYDGDRDADDDRGEVD